MTIEIGQLIDYPLEKEKIPSLEIISYEIILRFHPIKISTQEFKRCKLS